MENSVHGLIANVNLKVVPMLLVLINQSINVQNG